MSQGKLNKLRDINERIEYLTQLYDELRGAYGDQCRLYAYVSIRISEIEDDFALVTSYMENITEAFTSIHEALKIINQMIGQEQNKLNETGEQR